MVMNCCDDTEDVPAITYGSKTYQLALNNSIIVICVYMWSLFSLSTHICGVYLLFLRMIREIHPLIGILGAVIHPLIGSPWRGVGVRVQAWQPDSASYNCTRCKEAFTFFRRRHHCRACGGLFCHNCSTHLVLISIPR